MKLKVRKQECLWVFTNLTLFAACECLIASIMDTWGYTQATAGKFTLETLLEVLNNVRGDTTRMDVR